MKIWLSDTCFRSYLFFWELHVMEGGGQSCRPLFRLSVFPFWTRKSPCSFSSCPSYAWHASLDNMENLSLTMLNFSWQMTHIDTCWSGIQFSFFGGTTGGIYSCWPPWTAVFFVPRLPLVDVGVAGLWVVSNRESREIFLRGTVWAFLSRLPAADSRPPLSFTGVDVAGVKRPDSGMGVIRPGIAVMDEVGEEEGVWIRLCMMLLQSSVEDGSYVFSTTNRIVRFIFKTTKCICNAKKEWYTSSGRFSTLVILWDKNVELN